MGLKIRQASSLLDGNREVAGCVCTGYRNLLAVWTEDIRNGKIAACSRHNALAERQQRVSVVRKTGQSVAAIRSRSCFNVSSGLLPDRSDVPWVGCGDSSAGIASDLLS